MLKKGILPGVFSGMFLTFSLLFWYVVKRFFMEPFAWISFTNNFDANLIYLGITLIGLICFSALLSVIRPKSNLTKGTYFLAGLFQWIFIPFGPFLVVSMFIFFFAYLAFENAIYRSLHLYIKINFWDTFARNIPGLITTMTLVIAIVIFQSSINNVNNVKITIPDSIIEQTIHYMSLPAVKGESTSAVRELAQADNEAFEKLVNEQMERFGITDPGEQQLIREQIKQMYGVETTPLGSQSAQQTPSRSNQGNLSDILRVPVPPAGNALLNEVQNDYKKMIIEQTKKEVEQQIDMAIYKYRSYLPILNTLAIFFLLGIISLPVMAITIPLVTGLMVLLRKAGIISIVNVKEDVEHIAW